MQDAIAPETGLPRRPGVGRLQARFSLALGGLAVAGLMLAFFLLGSEVLEGETRGFDLFVLRAIQAPGPGHPWFVEAMRDLSGLGSTIVLCTLTGAGFGYLVLVSEKALAILLASATASGAMAVGMLKTAFGRSRPDAIFAAIESHGYGFPSGHATNSAIVFLTLGAIFASRQARPVERSCMLALAVLMAAMVGLSRVALGVHWPTDVIAGWAFGAAWALLWLLAAQWLAARNGAFLPA